MMTETILLYSFLFLLIHYLIFLSIIYRGLSNLKTVDNISQSTNEFISVIIPFRNESGKILRSLNSIQSQNYSSDKFEVIYVNDFSTDDSHEKISGAISSDNVRVISVPEDYSRQAHKKRAVRFGIENSKGKIIVTTDADCVHNPEWLSTLLSYFDKNSGFVSGPVSFISDGSFFSKFQALEFAGLVITGAGLIGAGKPTICNAANIAYRKEAFDKVNGFKDQMNLSSGDDELLMQKISKETVFKVKFCPDKNAVVKTEGNESIGQLYQQRKRWASKGLFYADKFLIVKLILIYLFYLSLPVQLILGLTVENIFLFSLSLSLLLKIAFEFSVLRKGIKIFLNNGLLKPFLIAEILHIPYIIIAGLSGLFGNYIWKDRVVKR